VEASCPAPAVTHTVEPETELCKLLADRRRIFRQLYRDLKSTFKEFSK
jgi:xylulokinase